jgi:hypothetical protein
MNDKMKSKYPGTGNIIPEDKSCIIGLNYLENKLSREWQLLVKNEPVLIWE